MTEKSLVKEFRVAEIFGPTIQGEGRHVGVPVHFVRLGGCDYRCVWCDTPHAVLPDQVAQLPKMSAHKIAVKVRELPAGPRWVVITGGNPALFDLRLLVGHLLNYGYDTMVETQGTIWNDWLAETGELCVSPKPPSAGNSTSTSVLRNFLRHHMNVAWSEDQAYLKVVVFDNDDYDYAVEIHEAFPQYEFYMSVGTHDPFMPTVGNPNPDTTGFGGVIRGQVRDTVGHDYRLLAERVAKDVRMRDVRVIPQLHVIAWGNERGH